MRTIIVAPPRSGTHTLHRTLRDMGVRVGHEEYFTPQCCLGLLDQPMRGRPSDLSYDRWARNDIEISWLAAWPAAEMVPLLRDWTGPIRTSLTIGVGIQFRHPFATIQSYLSTGFLTDFERNPYDRYALWWEQSVGNRATQNSLDRQAMFWALWVAQLSELRRRRAAAGQETPWWRIEDIKEPKHVDRILKLVDSLGSNPTCERVSPPQGTMSPLSPSVPVDFDPADLSEFPRELVAYFGAACGYKDCDELRTWDVERLQRVFAAEHLQPRHLWTGAWEEHPDGR